MDRFAPIVSDSGFTTSILFDASVNAGVIQTGQMTKHRLRKFRLSIKALLVVTATAAIVLTGWVNRPRGYVVRKVDGIASVLVDDDRIEKKRLGRLLESKRSWHNTWGKELEVIISAASSTPTTEIAEIVDYAQDAGLEKIKLRVIDSGQ